jgi:hypothetical protein
VALVVFGIPAALQQHRYMRHRRDFRAAHHIDWARVGIVGFILVAAIVTNVTVNLKFPSWPTTSPSSASPSGRPAAGRAPAPPEWSLLPAPSRVRCSCCRW